jgi:UDP-N-acetylmuramate-alanine ligase
MFIPPISTHLKNYRYRYVRNIALIHRKNNLISFIIGNAISRGNPGLNWCSITGYLISQMAGALYNFFLYDKEVIGVAGTHQWENNHNIVTGIYT